MKQNQLECSTIKTLPEDLEYYRDIITPVEEGALLTMLMGLELNPVFVGGRLAKRRMKCFGWDYDSTRKTISRAPAIPVFLTHLLATSAECCGRDRRPFDQAIVTWYPAGYGIGKHVDAEVFGGTVLGVSLATSATMRFQRGSMQFDQILDAGSLLVMSGSSRFEWQHEIIGRTVKAARWSVTFRSVMDPGEG